MKETQLRLPSQRIPNAVYSSPHEFFGLLEKTMGERLSEADQRLFKGCYSAQDFVTVIGESRLLGYCGFEPWKLAEIYVSLKSGFTLAKVGQRGYDLFGAFELSGQKAGTIQVKWCGPGGSGGWHKEIVGKDREIHYDVFLPVCGAQTRNPAKSSFLVIPAEDLQPIVDGWEGNGLPAIDISKHKYNKQNGKLNKWWDYHLPDHSKLRQRVQKYI